MQGHGVGQSGGRPVCYEESVESACTRRDDCKVQVGDGFKEPSF